MGSKQGPTSKNSHHSPQALKGHQNASHTIQCHSSPSVCDTIRWAFDHTTTTSSAPSSCRTPFSSLPLNYWWPRLQPPITPHPSHTSITSHPPLPSSCYVALAWKSLSFSLHSSVCMWTNSILTCTSTSKKKKKNQQICFPVLLNFKKKKKNLQKAFEIIITTPNVCICKWNIPRA